MSKPSDSNNEDFAALLKEFDAREGSGAQRGGARRRDVTLGETIRGRIVSIGRDAAFVALGSANKSEGMLELAELRDEEGKLIVQVGDEIEARVVDTSGDCVVLRRTLGRGPDARAELGQAHQLGIPVEGTVAAVNKGGVDVTVAGVRGFCPISQLDLRHVEDPATFIGQKLQFRITRYEADRRGVNLVLSRRVLLEEVQRARAVETRGRLTVGAVVPGVVTSLKDFGAFVDLGGVDGMLPASEIGYARGTRPADILSLGQRLEVQIMKIEKTDDPRRPERISLSLKSLARDPWEDAPTRFSPGTKVRGKVVRVEQFGAFVELEPGVDGLLHLEELGRGREARQARHARDLARPGDELEVTVLALDSDRRRISLGLAGGERSEGADRADLDAAARVAGPARLGTLGDLFKAAASTPGSRQKR